MPRIWQATSTKSVGGVSNGTEFNNSYRFEAEVDLDDPLLKALLGFIADAEVALLTSSVILKDISIKELDQGGGNEPQDGYVGKTFNRKGLRTSNGDLLPYDTCAAITRMASVKKNGVLLFRGVLGEDDVDAVAGSKYQLVPAAPGNAAAAMAAFCATMADPPDGIRWVFTHNPKRPLDDNRPVVAWEVTGVAGKQLKNNTPSADDDLERAVSKMINQGERMIASAIEGGAANAINPDLMRRIAMIGRKVLYLIRVLPPERTNRLVLGELWDGIEGLDIPFVPGI